MAQNYPGLSILGYSISELSTKREWRPWEKGTKVRDINGNLKLVGNPLTFTILKSINGTKQIIEI